jgi:hypothetical protein
MAITDKGCVMSDMKMPKVSQYDNAQQMMFSQADMLGGALDELFNRISPILNGTVPDYPNTDMDTSDMSLVVMNCEFMRERLSRFTDRVHKAIEDIQV